MGKLTSTIGIPIKLLNEAQVSRRCKTVYLEIRLILCAGPCCHTRAHLWPSIPWKATRRYGLRSFPVLLALSAAQPCVLLRSDFLLTTFISAEDNMNVQLKDITATARDGRVSHLDQVYIRGSHVRFFIVPDMLRNAPMFRSRGTRGRGVGLARGRATVNRARAGRRT